MKLHKILFMLINLTELTFCCCNFLFSPSKASDANIPAFPFPFVSVKYFGLILQFVNSQLRKNSIEKFCLFYTLSLKFASKTSA